MFIISFFRFIFVIIPVLINVAFITLFERKILGYSQLRKGPNKVGIIGFIQPFNDAIKLFSKEFITPSSRNTHTINLGPIIAIFLRLLVWITLPCNFSFSSSLSFVFIYAILSINIYPIIISGWSSNSNYAIIGGLRGIAQTISYEIRFALLIIFFLMLNQSFSVLLTSYSNFFFFKIFIFPPLFFIWLITSIAETNRTPFDFAEGESELVSGFNIEYGSVGFAMIFIAEYARIFFISVLFTLLISPQPVFSVLNMLVSSLVVFFWVWTRTTLPRYRYDILISLAWITILPLSLFFLFYPTLLII